MNRFLSLAVVMLLVLPFSASAADAPVKLDPPLSEEMAKLELFDTPRDIPDMTLTKADGGLSNLSDYKGKLIVLNFWATWCPPCVTELPSLNALQLALGGDDFQVITLSLDKGEEGQKAARDFLISKELKALEPFTDGYEQAPTLDILSSVAGIPVTLILDQDRKVLARYQGDADWNGRAARDVIEYYLKNTSYRLFKIENTLPSSN